MSFYTDLRATADALLIDKGAMLTFTRSAAGVYDPATGTAAVTLTDFTVTGAVFDYPDAAVNGTDILTGDKRVLVSAQNLTVVPTTGDYITIAGAKHSIIRIKRLAPAGVAVLYTLQARKGG